MRRRFLRDVKTAAGDIRFGRGEVRDYPSGTWSDIARAARVSIDKLTAPADEPVARETAA